MKKIFLSLSFILIALISYAQSTPKVQVLFFKTQLSCCAAKTCNALTEDVKKAVETNFNAKKVVFKEIAIKEEKNKELVKKHNAKHQNVLVVVTKKGKETVINITDLVADFSSNKDYAAFEKKLKEIIKKQL
ncbi:MAG: hypothetical protein CVU04_00635 [Bacteroidetes bacterium HGW-Bacteroidetes-20]|nr:MAG: hypothetical protein CVU04_00635 [Bacteroidetes bacterium HGW-Bacteroidetes-20]